MADCEDQRNDGGSRLAPTTLKLLCLLTDAHLAEIRRDGKDRQMYINSSFASIANRLAIGTKRVDVARSISAIRDFVDGISDEIKRSAQRAAKRDGQFATTVYRFAAHAFAQSLWEEISRRHRLYKEKVAMIEESHRQELDSSRIGCSVEMKRLLQDRQGALRAEFKESIRDMEARHAREAADLSAQITSLESDLKIEISDKEVLKERQQYLLKEIADSRKWKKAYEEACRRESEKESEFLSTIQRLEAKISDKDRAFESTTKSQEKEISKIKAEVRKLKQKITIHRQRMKKMTSELQRLRLHSKASMSSSRSRSTTKSPTKRSKSMMEMRGPLVSESTVLNGFVKFASEHDRVSPIFSDLSGIVEFPKMKGRVQTQKRRRRPTKSGKLVGIDQVVLPPLITELTVKSII